MQTELEAVQSDLSQRRRLLAVSERAYDEGRVTDTQQWIRSMRRQREGILAVEADLVRAAQTEETTA